MTKEDALTLEALKYAASKGYGSIVREMNIAPFVIRSDKALAQEQQSCDKAEERNFCSRCGKRLASGFVEISIHTCTPPKENT